MARTPQKKPRVRMERHHMLPRSRGGSSAPNNLIVLAQPVHRAWHYLVGNANAKEAARLLSVFIDPKYYFIAVPYHKVQPKHRRTRCMCTTCGAEVMKFLPKTNDKEDDTCDCRSCYNKEDCDGTGD